MTEISKKQSPDDRHTGLVERAIQRLTFGSGILAEMILTRYNALMASMRHNGVLKDLQSMGKARPEGIFKDI